MKKFWLSLGLTLMLACWCGEGYYGFGTSCSLRAGLLFSSLSCNPSDPACYRDYYPRPICGPTFPEALLWRSTVMIGDQRYQRHDRTQWREPREAVNAKNVNATTNLESRSSISTAGLRVGAGLGG